MKKLIELFNKKYGHIYGVIDDSVDNEDVFKAYKIINCYIGLIVIMKSCIVKQ